MVLGSYVYSFQYLFILGTYLALMLYDHYVYLFLENSGILSFGKVNTVFLTVCICY